MAFEFSNRLAKLMKTSGHAAALPQMGPVKAQRENLEKFHRDLKMTHAGENKKGMDIFAISSLDTWIMEEYVQDAGLLKSLQDNWETIVELVDIGDRRNFVYKLLSKEEYTICSEAFGMAVWAKRSENPEEFMTGLEHLMVPLEKHIELGLIIYQFHFKLSAKPKKEEVERYVGMMKPLLAIEAT